MKRFILPIGLLLAACLGAMPAQSGRAAGVPTTVPYVVTTVYLLNLRTAPRLSAPIIERLAFRTRLAFHGYHTSWVAVTAPDGKAGYVYWRDVTPVVWPPSAARAVPPAQPRYLVVRVGAHIRSGPSLTAAILTVAPPGTRLALLGAEGAWAHVKLPSGKIGWIYQPLTRAA